MLFTVHNRQASESVKQSACLCLLRLFRTSKESMTYADWASRVIHLLNDHHMVSTQTNKQASTRASERSSFYRLIWKVNKAHCRFRILTHNFDIQVYCVQKIDSRFTKLTFKLQILSCYFFIYNYQAIVTEYSYTTAHCLILNVLFSDVKFFKLTHLKANRRYH